MADDTNARTSQNAIAVRTAAMPSPRLRLRDVAPRRGDFKRKIENNPMHSRVEAGVTKFGLVENGLDPSGKSVL